MMTQTQVQERAPFPIARIDDRESSCAFLLGIALDQGQGSESAWAVPRALKERLGTLDPTEIARLRPRVLEDALRRYPALHRYPAQMAANLLAVCRRLAESYGGDARNLWSQGRTAGELLRELEDFAGIGPHKARLAVFLLTVEFGVAVVNDGSDVSIASYPGLCERYFPVDRAVLVEAPRQ